MYRDQLLKFGVFSFSLKSGIWLLGALAWSVGLIDRIISIILDGQIVIQEFLQLILLTAVLVSWFYLKPSSNYGSDFMSGIDDLHNLESKDESVEP